MNKLTIAQIDQLIDATFKIPKNAPPEEKERNKKLRSNLYNEKKLVIKELDKTQPVKLDTAEDILAQMSKPKKKKRAKWHRFHIVICGQTTWSDKSRIKAALKQFRSVDVEALITGTSKGAEQVVIPIAKALQLPVIQIHPMQHLGGASTIIHRNQSTFRLFKPTHVLAFHDKIDASVSSANYLKLAKKNEVPGILITKEDNQKSIAKKVRRANEQYEPSEDRG